MKCWISRDLEYGGHKYTFFLCKHSKWFYRAVRIYLSAVSSYEISGNYIIVRRPAYGYLMPPLESLDISERIKEAINAVKMTKEIQVDSITEVAQLGPNPAFFTPDPLFVESLFAVKAVKTMPIGEYVKYAAKTVADLVAMYGLEQGWIVFNEVVGCTMKKMAEKILIRPQ